MPIALALPQIAGDRSTILTGRTMCAAHAVGQDGDLRGARSRPDAAASGNSGKATRRICGAGASCYGELSAPAGYPALELLPIAAFASEPRLQRLGLSNYWGYNPFALWRCIHYAAGEAGQTPLQEFQQAVKALHAAGIEVILDVVFNHSAELEEIGPTLSLRGVDNASYYWLGDNGEYHWTGCGNTLNLSDPQVLDWRWARCVTGCKPATLTAFVSILPACSGARRIIVRMRRCLWPCRPVRCCRRKRSLNPGILGPAAIRWATFRPASPNGTTTFAIRRAATGCTVS